MTKIRVKVSPAGRFRIPVKLRRAMGLDAGGAVIMEMHGKDLVIRPIAETVAEADKD